MFINALDVFNALFLLHDRQPEELGMSKTNNFDVQSTKSKFLSNNFRNT